MDKSYTKRIIDLSLERIGLILDTYPSIQRVIYSCDDKDTTLIGTKIFAETIGDDVVQYISNAIRNLPTRKPSAMTFDRIREQEIRLYPWALIHDKYAQACEQMTKKDEKIAKLSAELKKVKAGSSASTSASSLAVPPGKKRPLPTGNGNIMKMLRPNA